jgi:hypothetical protein
MLTTVEGVYRNGQVELAEQPPGVKEARVFVTFVETKNGDAPLIGDEPSRMLQYGKYAGPDMSTEEDFKIAEWHGEPEFDDDYK